MSKKFLENEQYAFLVAKIAVLFQSFITSAVITILICIIFGISYPRTMLILLVSLDGLFVIAHLSYRRAYDGPKVVLMRNEKIILALHIITALLALTMTSFLIYKKLDVSFWFTGVLLMLWISSLVYGVLFFTKKYSANTRVIR